MSKWKQISLGELYDVHNGLSKSRDAFGHGYPFLSFSEVFNNYFLPGELKQLVESTPQEQESYSIHRGDVFITRTSETMDELGMSCVALRDYPQATYNGFTKRLRPKFPDMVLPEYVGYFLRTPLFRSKFVAFSTMTTRASLRNEDLLAMKISLPPIEMQRKIADILSAYDDLIENNRKQIKLLEEAAQRLYKEWFIDLRFPDYENTPIIDGIPAGWEKKTVGQLLNKFERTKQVQAADYLETGLFPIIDQSRNFIAGYTNDAETLIQHSQPIIVFGDHTRILKLIPFPFAKGADGTQIIVSNDSNMPQHLFFCSLREIDLSNYHYARHFKYLKTEEILVPTKKVAYKIEMQLRYFFTKIQQCRSVIIKSESARNILLSKLMTGELEVK